jgi:hypothetical protein
MEQRAPSQRAAQAVIDAILRYSTSDLEAVAA